MPFLSLPGTGSLVARGKQCTDITEGAAELLRLFIQENVALEKDAKWSNTHSRLWRSTMPILGMVGNPAIRNQDGKSVNPAKTKVPPAGVSQSIPAGGSTNSFDTLVKGA